MLKFFVFFNFENTGSFFLHKGLLVWIYLFILRLTCEYSEIEIVSGTTQGTVFIDGKIVIIGRIDRHFICTTLY